MSPYLPSDRYFVGDPDDAHVGRPFWVTFERRADASRFVELLTWYGSAGRWGCPFDQDRLHFQTVAYMRADIPNPYFL